MPARQFFTRDQLLLALGPTHNNAPRVFAQPVTAKFPIVSLEERKSPRASDEPKVLVAVGYKPAHFSTKYATLTTLVVNKDELDNLPREEFEL